MFVVATAIIFMIVGFLIGRLFPQDPINYERSTPPIVRPRRDPPSRWSK